MHGLGSLPCSATSSCSGCLPATAGHLAATTSLSPAASTCRLCPFRRAQYLPSILLVVVAGVAAALQRTDYLAFYLTGTYVGWVYLRFFQQQPDSALYGDSSDEFKFSSFFPPFLAPVVDPLAAALGFVTRLRHVPGAAEAAAAASAALLAQPSALGTDAVDANRRR